MGFICLISTIIMSQLMIFNFNESANINQWRIVDDVVMGGVSYGKVYMDKDGNGVFSGHVSLDNNGFVGMFEKHFQ